MKQAIKQSNKQKARETQANQQTTRKKKQAIKQSSNQTIQQ
jgi:hypothetical protein